MSIGWRLVNGLVFGISHQYQLDFDQMDDTEETLAEKLTKAVRVPVIFVYIGPLQLVISW